MADVSFELKLKTLNESCVWQNSFCPCWLHIGSQVHKFIVFWGFFVILRHHYRVDLKSNQQDVIEVQTLSFSLTKLLHQLLKIFIL